MAAKRLEAEIRMILRPVDAYKLNPAQRETLADLRQNLADARIYTNDYELSETREEQTLNAKRAKHWLKEAQEDILTASQHDIFSAIDVAHLSAQIEQIIGELK
jgi:transposase